jgi:PAS domain S-box-containing protein
MKPTNEVIALRRQEWAVDAVGLRKSGFSRLLLEASPDIIYVYDRVEQRYPFVSERCDEILGYTHQQFEQFSAQDVERLIHPEDLERVRIHYARQERLRDDEVAQATYRVSRLAGDYRLLRCRQKVLVRDPRGRVRHILGVATDVTEQANREREVAGLKAQVLSIREDEQRRIALRLHDTAVQHLVGAALLLNGIEAVAGADADRWAGVLSEVRTSLSRALRDIIEPLTTSLSAASSLDATHLSEQPANCLKACVDADASP